MMKTARELIESVANGHDPISILTEGWNTVSGNPGQAFADYLKSKMRGRYKYDPKKGEGTVDLGPFIAQFQASDESLYLTIQPKKEIVTHADPETIFSGLTALAQVWHNKF